MPQDEPQQRTAPCTRCGGLKTGKRVQAAWCNPCHAKYCRERRAKFTPEQRQRHLDQLRTHAWKRLGIPTPTTPNPGSCECCGKPEAENGGRRLSVDHCHASGRFRGWLCRTCNQGIGFLGDTAEGVTRALTYLSSRLH